MVILLDGLHVADADPTLHNPAHNLLQYSMLITTAPDSQATKVSTALLPRGEGGSSSSSGGGGEEEEGASGVDLPLLRTIDTKGGAVSVQLLSVSGRGMRARPQMEEGGSGSSSGSSSGSIVVLPACAVAREGVPPQDHAALFTDGASQQAFSGLPRTLSYTGVQMSSALTVCWNRRTVSAVMEWLGKATDKGDDAAVAAPPPEAAAPALMDKEGGSSGSAPSASAKEEEAKKKKKKEEEEAAAAAAAAANTSDGTSALRVAIRGVRLRLAKFPTIKGTVTYQPISQLNLAGLSVVLDSANATGMRVGVGLRNVELLDLSVPGNLHPAILGRRTPLSPLEDPSEAPTLVSVTFAAPPAAPTALTVGVEPMKITFLSAPLLGAFLPCLTEDVLGALVPPAPPTPPLDPSLRNATVFPLAADPEQRAKFGTMSVRVAAGTSIFVPISPFARSGLALELGAALTVGTHLEDGAFCRRRAGERGSAWVWGEDGNSSTTTTTTTTQRCAASVLQVSISQTRLLSIPSRAQLIPSLGVEVRLCNLVHPGAALKAGGLIDISLAPLALQLQPKDYAAIMGVLGGNLGGKALVEYPEAEECYIEGVKMEEAHIEAPPRAFRAAREACDVTGARFGGVRPRFWCARCGATVCSAALGGKVWDAQESKAKTVCKPCVRVLLGKVRGTRALSGGAEGGLLTQGGSGAEVDPLDVLGDFSAEEEGGVGVGGGGGVATGVVAVGAGPSSSSSTTTAAAAPPAADKAPSTLAINLPSVKIELFSPPPLHRHCHCQWGAAQAPCRGTCWGLRGNCLLPG